MISFIDEDQINNLIEATINPTRKKIDQIIKKSLKLKGLSLEETATLLHITDKASLNKLYKAAKKVKETIYGNRLVLFAPLYITNYCANNCLYCGFRKDNTSLTRKRLSLDEIKEEITTLEKEGYKRILMLGGEDSVAASIDYLEKVIPYIYGTKDHGEIRRLNVNVASMPVPDFKKLKKTGIGTYQLFQETYHPETYKLMHPSGPKTDYLNHLFAMHRALEAGIDDVGIGVLFGLYDYKFEVLALLSHAQELEKKFGIGPHTISVPRIEPAANVPLTNDPPFKVSDENFKKLVAILRLAVPYTGLILSTRESAKMRNELFGLGISQISAGSRTNPGGYKASKTNPGEAQQFSLNDDRSLLEVVKDISKMGFIPSFCTACYRSGRTGKDFMDLAKPGLIQKFCQPNALITFKEYLLDYGDAEAKKIGEKVIWKELNKLKPKSLKIKLAKMLNEVESGKRDLFL